MPRIELPYVSLMLIQTFACHLRVLPGGEEAVIHTSILKVIIEKAKEKISSLSYYYQQKLMNRTMKKDISI